MKGDKSEMTQRYNDYKNLIYKLAWTFSFKTGIEVEELISEFNIVFCESAAGWEKEIQKGKVEATYGTYLTKCCSNRICGILSRMGRKKRKNITFTDKEINVESHDPLESIIIYDNIVNNPNPIIQSIARIISIYNVPRKGVKTWLYSILRTHDYKCQDIFNAFDELKGLYES